MTLISIDGPVGAGKSTVARAVARRLGLRHLDTGAMYRSVALAAVRGGIDVDSASPGDLAAVAREARIDVGERVILDGADVTSELRSPEVGRVVSAVAARPEVRVELVRRQREWAQAHGGGVVEGRDIGSVVFPDADLKVFLTATDEERARRRRSDETAADLARRDRLDSSRAASPLTVADGARVIDTTSRSVDDIVEEIVGCLAPPAAPPPAAARQPIRGPVPGVSAPGLDMALYRFCRFLVMTICRTYWRAAYEGLQHVPASGPYVLAPVHRSFIDFGLAAGVTGRRVRFMGKEELWESPRPFRWLLSALGAFPVNRSGTDREAMRRSMAVLEGGEPLVLFPEGTRQSGPVVEKLHLGAAYVASRAGVPIVPVGIGGSERALRKGRRVPRPVKVHVVVGPPILSQDESGGRTPRRAVDELSDRLRGELQSLFDRAQEAVMR